MGNTTNVVSFRPTGVIAPPDPQLVAMFPYRTSWLRPWGLALTLYRLYGPSSNPGGAPAYSRVARGLNIIVCVLRGPEILAGLPAMTTETMFLIVTRYQLRNTYVNGTLLVSTYLCLQKLTPIKGFPKCSLLIMIIISNLQSGPKIFMRASCGPRFKISARVQLWAMAMPTEPITKT